MRKIKYKYLSSVINNGTEEEPKLEEFIIKVTMDWTEANEEIAKSEAYNGEYEIYDDGEPEPIIEPTP